MSSPYSYDLKRMSGEGWELVTNRTDFICLTCGKKLYPPFFLDNCVAGFVYCPKCAETGPLKFSKTRNIELFCVGSLKIKGTIEV